MLIKFQIIKLVNTPVNPVVDHFSAEVPDADGVGIILFQPCASLFLPFECLPDEQIEQELTVEFLQRFEEEVKESGEKILLILDDVVNDIRKNKGVDKVLAKILYNRRHITADGGDDANGVTVWLTTQSYNRMGIV
eukprot:SAG22_NODE_279_length_13134_cov_7.532561_4_plen_136_part_00